MHDTFAKNVVSIEKHMKGYLNGQTQRVSEDAVKVNHLSVLEAVIM